MKLSKLLENISVLSSTADPELEVADICYDSRNVFPGCAFFAIRGFESDGHRFIPNAVKAGASVVICEDVPDTETSYVLVENARTALALMSCAFFGYPAAALKVIGVTGTSGKTTSTHLIKHIIEETLQAKVGLIGTNANMIGDRELHTEHTTPESYELQKLFREMVDEGCTYAVMEVSSHALSLDRVAGIPFVSAAYTNLSQDHLDFHGTMDAYAQAKSLLFAMCGNACVNLDDGYAEVMVSAVRDHDCPLITTAVDSGNATMRAENLRFTSSSVAFDVSYAGESCSASLSIPGMFSVYNALTALSVCVSCGIPLQDAVSALGTASGVKGRMETVPTGKEYTVLIDYSHKPDALEKALRTLRPVTSGRLIVLFGCGGDRDRLKRPIMGRVACECADVVVVTSDNPRTEDPDAIISEILQGIPAYPDRNSSGHNTSDQNTDTQNTVNQKTANQNNSVQIQVITDRVNAIHWALDNARSGDVILLAGKGHEDYQIVGHEKHHMDEREIVADHLRNP